MRPHVEPVAARREFAGEVTKKMNGPTPMRERADGSAARTENLPRSTVRAPRSDAIQE